VLSAADPHSEASEAAQLSEAGRWVGEVPEGDLTWGGVHGDLTVRAVGQEGSRAQRHGPQHWGRRRRGGGMGGRGGGGTLGGGRVVSDQLSGACTAIDQHRDTQTQTQTQTYKQGSALLQ